MLKFLVFIGIFCTAAAVLKTSKHNGKDKIVNLALETVFEFDKENKKTDVNILNKVQNFIGRVKNAIENQKVSRRNMRHSNKNIFNNFIVNLIRILLKYEDNDLEDFALIISTEMKNHRGTKFHELAENIDFQKFFGDKFAKIRKKPAADIRHHLETLSNKLGEGNYVKDEEELWDAINYMYREDSIPKFNKFVADIDDYRLKSRKNIDLSQIINGGLKSILFDHFSSLNIKLRSILMSKLQDYMKYYHKNQNDAKYTTDVQTISELRTRRQIYMEKNQKLRQIKHDYDKWLKEIRSKKYSTTHMTRRPHSVPTTKKKLQIIKDDDVKPAKEYKKSINVKATTRSNKDTFAYKKRGYKTTEELRTLRQMYVEKNLDLKYDPDAYEHLTTDIKRNTKTVNPSTSPTAPNRRPNKNTYKYTFRSHSLRQSMKSKHVQKQDSDFFDESKIKSDDLDSKSEDLTPKLIFERRTSSKYTDTTKLKLTKMVRNFGQTFINKDSDDQYNFKPEYRSQKKNITFKILQPTKSRNSKRNFSVPESKYKMRSGKFGSSAGTELYTIEPGRPNVIEIVNDIGYSFDIKKGTDLDSSDHKSDVQNPRYENKKRHYRKDNSMIFKDRLLKTTKLKPVQMPVFRRQNRESLRAKLEISKEPLILSRRYDSPHNIGRQQYRRRYLEVPIVSQEGLSIEGFGGINRKKYYGKNNNPDTTVNIHSNTYVLGRIQKLENDLKLVKTQIKNDTKIKDLSHNENETNVSNNDNRLVIKPEKSTYGINSKSDVDNILKSKNINAVFSTETPEIYENTITEQSPKEKRVIESKYDVNLINSKSKIDNDVVNLPLKATTVSKKTSTLESNIIDQGRKNFQDLKQIETQSDKAKLNKKPDDSDSLSRKSKKHVDHSLTTNKTRQIINGREKDSVKGTTEKVFYFRVNKEINEKRFNGSETTKNKYTSTVSPSTNNIFYNQSEDKLNKSWVEVNRQFKNKDGDIPVKFNDFEENFKTLATRTELTLNRTNEVKDDQKLDSSGIAFRARMDETTFMPIIIKNCSNLPKANEGFKPNGTVTNTKILQETKTTETNSSDSKAISYKLGNQIVEEVGEPNDNKECIGVLEKDNEAMDIHLVLNLGPSPSIINDTSPRQQNSINIQIPSTITGFMYTKA